MPGIFTRHGRRGILEARYFHQGGVVVVLGAWYYTRAAGTDVIHVAMKTAAGRDESQGTDISWW